MRRARNRTSWSAILPAVLLVGCRSTEQELIDRFFAASQRGDNETVAALSMVAFPEELTEWRVLGIGGAQQSPYEIPELRKAVEEAEDARAAQFKGFGAFRQENYDDLARIQRQLRQNPEQEFPGRLGELQTAWDNYRGERKDIVARLHRAEQELEEAFRRVTKSLQRESSPEYLVGETVQKRARVRVSTNDGDRFYWVTLTRYELRNQFDAVVPARWIITEIAPES